jgi:hypothetical protein
MMIRQSNALLSANFVRCRLSLSNPGIARKLVLREYTVHRHLADILRKLDLS